MDERQNQETSKPRGAVSTLTAALLLVVLSATMDAVPIGAVGWESARCSLRGWGPLERLGIVAHVGAPARLRVCTRSPRPAAGPVAPAREADRPGLGAWGVVPLQLLDLPPPA